jgi:hypothetical protein
MRQIFFIIVASLFTNTLFSGCGPSKIHSHKADYSIVIDDISVSSKDAEKIRTFLVDILEFIDIASSLGELDRYFETLVEANHAGEDAITTIKRNLITQTLNAAQEKGPQSIQAKKLYLNQLFSRQHTAINQALREIIFSGALTRR